MNTNMMELNVNEMAAVNGGLSEKVKDTMIAAGVGAVVGGAAGAVIAGCVVGPVGVIGGAVAGAMVGGCAAGFPEYTGTFEKTFSR